MTDPKLAYILQLTKTLETLVQHQRERAEPGTRIAEEMKTHAHELAALRHAVEAAGKAAADATRILTAREREVMILLANGMSCRDVGDHLGISVKTADTHRQHVLQKLDLRNVSDLTRFAIKHGYVTVDGWAT